jgi:hypothetical protein
MLTDQLALFVISLVVALGAAMQARAAGVFSTMFVVSGFGWGQAEPSVMFTRTLLFSAGVAAGLLFSAFAWFVSGQYSANWLLLILVNVGVAILPSHLNVIRVLGFAMGNFLVLALWLTRSEDRRAESRV